MASILVRSEIRFLLNDQIVSVSNCAATDTLLDFLRLNRTLTGTKEGCAEGDCGACTVLVGRPTQNGGLVYESVNACIRFVGSLDGTHVVTVEHLKKTDGTLHPIQDALVRHHGSQCGFCTPGIVMSLYGLWMQNPRPDFAQIEKSLQGNLCRCTGYQPIIRAAQDIQGTPAADRLIAEKETVISKLQSMADGARVECGPPDNRLIVPASVDDFAEVYADHPGATIVAGSTDVGLWVTKMMRPISPAIFISHLDELRQISKSAEGLTLGAGVSYTDAFEQISDHCPPLVDYWERIGGEQVRNMGTVGGNIANGSPIGDTPPVLIALGSTITLRKGTARRTVILEDYFIEYGKQDRGSGEFVEQVHIPAVPADAHYAAYKISKRRDEDISALAAGLFLQLEGDVVKDIRIAYGGMAGTPKRAEKAEDALRGAVWSKEAIAAAKAALASDFQPLTDWRASAAYRLLAAQNLLERFYLETSGQAVALNRKAQLVEA